MDSGGLTNALKVLLVDEHGVVRSGLRAWLEERDGFDPCGEASNGEEAVSLVQRLRPDLVVLDPLMAGWDAGVLVGRLRGSLPRAEVLLYVDWPCELAHAALASGAKALVLKTDPAETFFAAVSALARHQPFQSHRGPVAAAALTRRELEVARLVARSFTTRQISSELAISQKTVETHRGNILRKLGARSVAGVALFAQRNGLIRG